MKIKMENLALEGCLTELLKKIPGVWDSGADNIVNFKKGKKAIGKLSLGDGEVTITGKEIEKTFKEVREVYKTIKKKALTKETAKGSVFESYFDSPGDFGNIATNYIIFNKLNSEFKKAKINNVIVGQSLARVGSCQKNITLAIECSMSDNANHSPPSGYYSRLKTFLFQTYKTNAENADTLFLKQHSWLESFEGEAVEEIQIKGTVVGNYHRERNLLLLFFNPFILKETLPFDENLSQIYKDLIDVLVKLKITKEHTKDLQNKMFVSAFLKRSRDRLTRVESSLKEKEKHLKDSYRNVRTIHKDLSDLRTEQSFIEENIRSDGKNLFKEIEITKRLSFVEKVEIGSEWIKLHYIPATIKMPEFSRTDHGKKFGNRIAYLGRISFKISASNINVESDSPMEGGSPHPHATSTGSPCFGSGDGQRQIFEMLATNKIAAVAKLLWFWVKIYINKGAHYHYGTFYKDRLRQGYPMWDDKGQRIKLNEPKRLKSKEQEKTEKADNYENNVKKFKDLKVF